MFYLLWATAGYVLLLNRLTYFLTYFYVRLLSATNVLVWSLERALRRWRGRCSTRLRSARCGRRCSPVSSRPSRRRTRRAVWHAMSGCEGREESRHPSRRRSVSTAPVLCRRRWSRPMASPSSSVSLRRSAPRPRGVYVGIPLRLHAELVCSGLFPCPCGL